DDSQRSMARQPAKAIRRIGNLDEGSGDRTLDYMVSLHRNWLVTEMAIHARPTPASTPRFAPFCRAPRIKITGHRPPPPPAPAPPAPVRAAMRVACGAPAPRPIPPPAAGPAGG